MKLYTHECKGLADGCTAYIAGSSNGVRYLRVQNPANRTSAMVLKAYENSDIEDDGIIAVHPIVAKLLQVDHGGSCVVEDVGTLTSPTPETHQAVTVRFISYQSSKHWDEFSLNTSPLMLYGQWQTKWPSSIPVQVVESMMPTMLLSACLCPGHRFVLHLSDNYLVRPFFSLIQCYLSKTFLIHCLLLTS